MQYSEEENLNSIPLSKYELMLKSKHTKYFDANEFENIINYYFETGKISKANQAIKIALSQHPSSVNLQLFLVESLVIDNKISKAESILEYLIELEPHNVEVYIQKANILSKKNNHQAAINLFHKAINIASSEEIEADLHSLIGMEYIYLENYNNALKSFKTCVEIDTQDYSALHNIMYCFDFLDQPEEAISYLNSYLDENPYSEMAWHQLGIQYVSLKDYKKAITAFDFAIISDDTFIGAYLEKGKVLELQKKYREAIENYKITLALDDPTSFALLRMGYCYQKLNQPKKALENYKQTINEDPLLDKGWIAIINYYLQQKNLNKALYYINKAIDIDADNSLYWKLYASTNRRLGMFEEAERGYKQTLELGNYELETWIDRADVLILLGEYEAAAYNLIQANDFYTEQAEIEYRLAGIYFTIHNTNKALFHLKNGLSISKDYVFIIKELFPAVVHHKDYQFMVNH